MEFERRFHISVDASDDRENQVDLYWLQVILVLFLSKVFHLAANHGFDFVINFLLIQNLHALPKLVNCKHTILFR